MQRGKSTEGQRIKRRSVDFGMQISECGSCRISLNLWERSLYKLYGLTLTIAIKRYLLLGVGDISLRVIRPVRPYGLPNGDYQFSGDSGCTARFSQLNQIFVSSLHNLPFTDRGDALEKFLGLITGYGEFIA